MDQVNRIGRYRYHLFPYKPFLLVFSRSNLNKSIQVHTFEIQNFKYLLFVWKTSLLLEGFYCQRLFTKPRFTYWTVIINILYVFLIGMLKSLNKYFSTSKTWIQFPFFSSKLKTIQESESDKHLSTSQI